MNRLPVADWAATAPWSGITGKPEVFPTAPVDLSQVKWAGVAANRYPVWNGTRFVPTAIPSSSSSSNITVVDEPSIAVRRRPPGQPNAQFQNVWARYEANVKLFGAAGDGSTPDADAVNAAITAVNSEGGGCLYFPPGNYQLWSGLQQITVPCLIRGDGIGVSVLSMGGNIGPYFNGSGTDTWFGATGIAVEETINGFAVEGGRIAIFGCAVECSGVGVFFSGTQGGWVDSSLFLSMGTATAIYGNPSNVEFSDLRFLGDEQWRWCADLPMGTANSFYDCYAANVLNSVISLGTATFGNRVANLMFRDVLGANPVLDAGSNNYVNELFGLSGNTNTNFNNRKELLSVFSWNVPPIPVGTGYYDDFNVPGASFGDQVVYGVPVLFGPASRVQAQVVASDTVRISVVNLGTATVDIDSGNWKLRVLN